MELADLQRLLALARAHDVAELEIASPSGRIRFRRTDQSLAPPTVVHQAVVPVPAEPVVEPASIAPAASVEAPDAPHAEAIRLAELHDDSCLHLVRASGVGVFLPPDDGDHSLVIGARVTAGAPLGWIRSLGVKHSIVAPVSGVVAAVYAHAGDPLQYGHLIVGIDCSPPDQN